jgi:hypothetical protein
MDYPVRFKAKRQKMHDAPYINWTGSLPVPFLVWANECEALQYAVKTTGNGL